VEVLIIETKTGVELAKIAIASGQSGHVSNQECCNRAWKVAVSVKSADPARRKEYSFKVS
jgi:hypothetical protein